jgi:drug/metabolite transporter superfamily protein YnfA
MRLHRVQFSIRRLMGVVAIVGFAFWAWLPTDSESVSIVVAAVVLFLMGFLPFFGLYGFIWFLSRGDPPPR